MTSVKPVKVIESADLEENGGVYTIEKNQVIRVRGLASTNRPIEKGNCMPVYVVSDAELASGAFSLARGGKVLDVADIDDIGANLTVRGRVAIPVYATNDWPASVSPVSPLLTDLFAYYKLDELSGDALDAHTNGYNLTDNNTVGYNADGIIEGSREFVRTNTESFSASVPVISGDFTVSVWFYPTDNPVATNRFFISRWNQSDSTDRQWRINARNSSGSLFIEIKVSQSDFTVSTLNTSNQFTPNSWNHVFLYYEDSTKTVYSQLNAGTIDNIVLPLPINQPASPPFHIGTIQPPSSTYSYGGRIDEVAVWSRLLTSDERTEVYNGGSGLAYPFS